MNGTEKRKQPASGRRGGAPTAPVDGSASKAARTGNQSGSGRHMKDISPIPLRETSDVSKAAHAADISSTQKDAECPSC